MELVKINSKIFREYDIRGIYNTDITEDTAYTLGRSFGSYIEEKVAIIGHDNRVSSPSLHEALIRGLTESGVRVVDLGLVTTPMYYYAKKSNKIKSGIMITASHNAKEYNGFKMSFEMLGNAYGKAIQDFREYTDKLEFESGEGSVVNLDIKQDYINLIKNSVDINNKKRVVVDCGNGTASIIIKDILDALDLEYELLYCESDGTFPNHTSDPCERENQIELAAKVRELGYDIGIGIDGDGDRVGIVDEKGNILSTDYYMILMYRYLNIPDKRAIFDVKCSRVLIDELEKLGYDYTMNRTGNSYQNAKINGENYIFGGEYSGHVYFRDKFMGFDDGIYAGLRAIEVLSEEGKPLSELLTGLNKYYQTEELKVKVTDESKFKIVKYVLDYADASGYKYEDIDGVRVEFEDSWALVRASNTSPKLTLRFEATTESRLEEIQDEFSDVIKEAIKQIIEDK